MQNMNKEQLKLLEIEVRKLLQKNEDLQKKNYKISEVIVKNTITQENVQIENLQLIKEQQRLKKVNEQLNIDFKQFIDRQTQIIKDNSQTILKNDQLTQHNNILIQEIESLKKQLL